MRTLLLVTSSVFGDNSKSGQLAREFVDAWRQERPGTRVVERDLGGEPLPHLTGATLSAIMTPAEQRTPEQAAVAQRADELIEEVEAADVIVMAVPMYNFSIPLTLKAWIDHVARAGRTFRYTADGPVGLLKGKKVIAVMSRGGVYSRGPAKAFDFQEPYLRHLLGFLGITEVTVVYAEGLNISPETAANALATARNRIASIVPQAQAA